MSIFYIFKNKKIFFYPYKMWGIYEQDLKLRIKISYESLLVFTKPLANVL